MVDVKKPRAIVLPSVTVDHYQAGHSCKQMLFVCTCWKNVQVASNYLEALVCSSSAGILSTFYALVVKNTQSVTRLHQIDELRILVDIDHEYSGIQEDVEYYIPAALTGFKYQIRCLLFIGAVYINIFSMEQLPFI